MCARQESNLRPSGPQPDALSTELRALVFTDNSQTLTYNIKSNSQNKSPKRACVVGDQFLVIGELNMKHFLDDVNHARFLLFFWNVIKQNLAHGIVIEIA